jgi:hypothetical protein
MKRTISVPFNFQHITHTDSRQFPGLEETSEHDLASEFSAIRASQAPNREIRGIRVQDLHYRNFSSDAVTSNMQTHSSEDTSSILTSGQKSEFQHRQTPSPSGSHRTFGPSQPISARHSLRARSPTSPITPPPRTSSRQAWTVSYDEDPESQTAHGPDRSTSAGGFRTPTSLDGLILAPTSNLSPAMQAPHAVTTPDDSAWHLKPPAFLGAGPGLADVPEEEEGMFSKRSSRRSSRPNSSGSALRQTQSLGDMKSMLDQVSRNSLMRAADLQRTERPESTVSEGSDTLEGPYCKAPVKGAVGIPGSSRRLSVGLHAVEGCWEDDIDYCYEHEVEADCDYDWDRSSEDEGDSSSASVMADSTILEQNKATKEGLAIRPRSPSSEVTSEKLNQSLVDSKKLGETQSFASIPKPPLLVPAYIPHSDPQSAQSVGSAITIDSDLPTPQSPPDATALHFNRPMSYASTTFRESDGFTLSPSLLILADFKTHMLADGYEDMATSDKQVYPFYNPIDVVDAARASTPSFRSPLSQSTSQESIIIPSSPSKHKSSNSGGSLPELVQSRNVRQEFDQAAEQLADHIAALNTADQSSEPQRSKSHRHQRNRSLAMDVAQQSILRKVASSSNIIDQSASSSKQSPTLNSSDEDAAVPAPISFGQRSRNGKDLSKIKIVAKAESPQKEGPKSPLSPRTPPLVSKIPMPVRSPPRSPRTSNDASRIPSPVFAPQRSRAHSETALKAPKVVSRPVGKHVRAISSTTRYSGRGG